MKKYLSIILLLFIFSCKKSSENNMKNEKFQNEYSNRKISQDETIVGKGFGSVEKELKERCLDNISYKFIENKKIYTHYYSNLNLENLSNELNINVNGNIDSSFIAINKDLEYLKLNDLNSLVVSNTVIKKIGNGYFQLSKLDKRSHGYKMNEIYSNIMNQSISEYLKICGDEFIETQQLSAFLVLTAKIEFSDDDAKNKVMKFFNNRLNIFEEFNVDVLENAKIYALENNLKSKVKIYFYGFQLGGDHKQLNSILKKISCNLSDLSECFVQFKMLQTYLNEGFIEQLDIHNFHQWVTAEVKTKQYSNILITDQAENYLTDKINIGNNIILFKENLAKLNKRNAKFHENSRDFLNSQDIYNYSLDEVEIFKTSLKISGKNYDKLREVYLNCGKSYLVEKCIGKYANGFDVNFDLEDKMLDYKKIQHIDTLTFGDNLVKTKTGFYFKKSLPISLFEEKKLNFILLDIYGYEVKSDAIELHCKKDFSKKFDEISPVIKYGAFIFHWPFLINLIDISVNDDFQRLDIIWNKKRSDILKNDIYKYCGEKGEVFLVTKEGSQVSRIILRKVK